MMADNVALNSLLETSDERITPQPQANIDTLAQAKQLLDQKEQKLMRALTNDYEGYKLDVGQDGQSMFGSKGYMELEKDKLIIERLRREIQKTEEAERRRQELLRSSNEELAELQPKVLADELKFGRVNKVLHDEITELYNSMAGRSNWATPELATRQAKERVLQVLARDAIQGVRVKHYQERGAENIQQADTGDLEPTEATDSKLDKYGFEIGSQASKIMAMSEGVGGKPKTLAQVAREKAESGGS